MTSGNPTKHPVLNVHLPEGCIPPTPLFVPLGITQPTCKPVPCLRDEPEKAMKNAPTYNPYPVTTSEPYIPPTVETCDEPGAYPQGVYHEADPRVISVGNTYAFSDEPVISHIPSGCVPTGAQKAALYGNTMVGTQLKTNWVPVRSGGGVLYW